MAALYKLYNAPTGQYIIKDGGGVIPVDPRNGDYQEYLLWAETNTPDPADPPALTYNTDAGLSGRTRTNNAAPAELFRQTLATQTGYVANLTVIAVDIGNGAVKTIKAIVVCKRLGGNALMVGTPTVISAHQDASASTWQVSGSVSGNDFVITVTGEAGKSIVWSLHGSFISFTPQGR